MIYSSCPTCGFFIGNVIDDYEEKKKEICSNKKITEEEQQKKIQQLIMKLDIPRYCCRMRIMTCKDMVEEILPVNN